MRSVSGPFEFSRLLPALSSLTLAMALASGCERTNSPRDIELRDGQPVAQIEATPLYTPDFVIRAMAADGESLYLSGLRFNEPDPDEPDPGEQGEGADPGEDEGEDLPPTGVIVKVPLLGVPEVLAEGAFLPMTSLELVDGKLYWHERHDSPDGPGLRSLTTDGSTLDRISDRSGHSWVIRPDAVYFTRPDDEIDEGGFYVLEQGKERPRLVARRRGVVRSLLGGHGQEHAEASLYWTTRSRKNGTWGVYEWDGGKSGKELLRSDETFASISIDGEDFLWVTWAEDAGEPLHSLYRRPIAGGEVEVVARKQGLPGFMEVFADERHVYLTTVRGGELRRLPKSGGEIELLAGSGDREVASNRYNLFWVDEQRVYWRGK